MSGAYKIDQSLGFRPQASAPSNPSEGDIYNDAIQGLLQFKSGNWIGLGSGGATRSMFIAGGDFVVPFSSGNSIIYQTVDIDTHNGYNVLTGEYTVPYDGLYRLSASAGGDFTNDSNSFFYRNLAQINGGISVNRGGGINPSANRIIFLNQGDKITYTNSSSASISTAAYNYFSVEGISADIPLNGTSLIITDWIPFTPVGTWDNVTYSGAYRRVGDSLEMQVHLIGTGTPTTTNLFIDLPAGLVIDEDKLINPNADDGPRLGGGSLANASPFELVLLYDAAAALQVGVWYVSTADSQMTPVSPAGNPINFSTGNELWIKTTAIPILGWSSAAAPISVPRSEVVLMGGNGKGNVNTDVRRYQYVVSEMGDALTLTQDADDGDSITVNEGGIYAITAADRGTVGAFSAYVMMNNVTGSYALDGSDLIGIFEQGSGGYTASISVTRYLPPGTVIRVCSGATLEDYATTYLAQLTVTQVSR